MYTKNIANSVFFFLRAINTGAGITGLSPTGKQAKDKNSQGDVEGTFTELGNGQYRFDGTAEDFNGDVVGFVFFGAGAIAYDVTVTTTLINFEDLTTPTNVSRVSNIIHRS